MARPWSILRAGRSLSINVGFEVRHGQEQAKKLGPNVAKLVEQLFANDHPLRHLRRVQ